TCFNSAELTEDQLLLLLESLEEKIVPQQLKLVREHISHLAQNEGKRGLLSFPQEKEQELTIAMVEMSGVTLQKDGSVACVEDAFPALAALCVSLYVLHVLN
ncbi:GSDA3 protein, partial [Rhinoptilus africanus]|nr:GSDA3 protein [Rhinoptilus africanus]